MWGETQICRHDLDNGGCEALNTERERPNWLFFPTIFKSVYTSGTDDTLTNNNSANSFWRDIDLVCRISLHFLTLCFFPSVKPETCFAPQDNTLSRHMVGCAAHCRTDGWLLLGELMVTYGDGSWLRVERRRKNNTVCYQASRWEWLSDERQQKNPVRHDEVKVADEK